MASSKNGVRWTKPIAVAHPGTTVLWPWIAAGTPGNVSVVWYQYDRPTPNPDQATAGNVTVMDANLFGVGTKHVARTVCRRAERHVVRLQREVELPPLAIIYLNRLSDLLFTLARVANRRAGAGEVTW